MSKSKSVPTFTCGSVDLPGLRHSYFGLPLLGMLFCLACWPVTSASAQTAPGVSYSNTAPTTLAQVSPVPKIACDPQIRQQMLTQAAAATRNDIATSDSIRHDITKAPPSSIMSCVNSNWPSLSLSFPTMDQLLKQAEQYVINQACTMANNAIAQVESPITSYGGAWGSIPGLGSSYGGGVNFNGGKTLGGNTGTCTTVNGVTTCAPPPGGGLNGIL